MTNFELEWDEEGEYEYCDQDCDECCEFCFDMSGFKIVEILIVDYDEAPNGGYMAWLS